MNYRETFVGASAILYSLAKWTARIGVVTWPVTRNLFDDRNIAINYNNHKINIIEAKKDDFLYFDRLTVTWSPSDNDLNVYTQNYYSFRKINLKPRYYDENTAKENYKYRNNRLRQTCDFILTDKI
jgi:hypothetical protein